MKILVVSLVVILFLALQVSANSSVVNIYLDATGNALFIGTTNNSEINLPSGIEIENGEIRGITSALTNKEGEVWEFSFTLEEGEFFIFLPDGTTLTSVSSGAEIYLSENQLAVYGNNEVNITYITKTASEDGLINIAVLTMIIVILGILIFIYLKKKKDKRNEKQNEGRAKKMKLIEQMLNEREKIILDKLKETGKVKSSYLRKMSGIPKASFSRHIQELEKKKIIKRSGEGRNKFVELIEK